MTSTSAYQFIPLFPTIRVLSNTLLRVNAFTSSNTRRQTALNMPNYSNFILSPNVFRSPSPGIPVSFCDEHDIEKHLPEFFESITDGVVGLAPLYLSPTCNFRTLAVASRTRVLVVTLHRLKAKAKAAKPVSDAPEKSLRALLCHSPILKCAFQMDRIAASLYLDFGVYITAAQRSSIPFPRKQTFFPVSHGSPGRRTHLEQIGRKGTLHERRSDQCTLPDVGSTSLGPPSPVLSYYPQVFN